MAVCRRGAPLISRGEVFGLIGFDHGEPEAYSPNMGLAYALA